MHWEASAGGNPRVLVLSRNYPTAEFPHLGPWVEGLTRRLEESCELRVVAPVPYAPRLPFLPESYARFRRVPATEVRNGIAIEHPRFFTGPGYSTHSLESRLMYIAARRAADDLRPAFSFDLIHAHFIYPEGVVAAKLARRYGVPFVVTEHSFWKPWLDEYPRVGRLAVQAAADAASVMVASQALEASVRDFTGQHARLRRVPIGIDERTFSVGTTPRDPNRIVCVGRIQYVKGSDVLIQALPHISRLRPEARLTFVGGSFYPAWQKEEDEIKALAGRLGVDSLVTFTGPVSHAIVCKHLQEAAVLVSPSRRETFGTVLAEALACGTPVVATDSGGPADIVSPDVGRLVPTEDPEALAAAIIDVLDRREQFEAHALRQIAVERYSWGSVARRVREVYDEALAGHGSDLP